MIKSLGGDLKIIQKDIIYLLLITASMLSGQTWQDPFNNFDNWTNTTSSSGEAWVISSDGYQGNCAQSSSGGTGYGDQLIKEHTFASSATLSLWVKKNGYDPITIYFYVDGAEMFSWGGSGTNGDAWTEHLLSIEPGTHELRIETDYGGTAWIDEMVINEVADLENLILDGETIDLSGNYYFDDVSLTNGAHINVIDSLVINTSGTSLISNSQITGDGYFSITTDDLQLTSNAYISNFDEIIISTSNSLLIEEGSSINNIRSITVITNQLTIDEQSSISSNGTSNNTQGTGGNGGANSGAGGAGYGGDGGQGGGSSGNYGIAGTAYGDFPDLEEGSKGGDNTYWGISGGLGGGLIQITASYAIIEGMITSNGAAGGTSQDRGSGGGSGGGISIIANNFEISGSIEANGGDCGCEYYSGGAGGGGRIYIQTDSPHSFWNNLIILSGNYWSPLPNPAHNGSYLVDTMNGGQQGNDLILDNQVIYLSGTHNYENVELSNNSILYVQGNLDLQIENSFIIDISSSINANSTSNNTQGTGGNGGANSGAGGAGYGGGGAGSGGSAYGGFPDLEEGSKGGDNTYWGISGGLGGGLIQITASYAIIEGMITSNGAAGGTYQDRGSGGGSGGGISIIANNFEISGSIEANGGDCGCEYYSGGAGGGGRIYIATNSPHNFWSNLNVDKGDGGPNGATNGEYLVEPISESGCTDPTACNYDPDALYDDGSCLELDCAGECGGVSEYDNCGVCDNIPENDCPDDCTDDDGNPAEVDECGICDGPGAIYECGCANIPDGECDCSGGMLDECGVCVGGNTDMDCNGDCFGEALLDSCDICSGGNTDHIADSDQDCNGVCFGASTIDGCGVCDSNSSNDCPEDCAGTYGGDAVWDDCGICSGGISNHEYNSDMDCTGTCFGESIEDPFDGCCLTDQLDGCGECSGNGYDYCDYDGDGVSNVEQWGYGVHTVSIEDVPEDQGGQVIMNFSKSCYDTDTLITRSESYTIELLDNNSWIVVQSFGSYGSDIYSVLVPTLNNNVVTEFRIIANMDEGNFLTLESIEGTSIDNIHPSTPDDVMASSNDNDINISWDYTQDIDFSYHQVSHLGTSTYTTDNEQTMSLSSDYNEYYINSIDIHDNYSDKSDYVGAHDLHAGANLIGVCVIPEDNSVSNVVSGPLEGIIGEGVAASNNPAIGWVGSLTEISPSDGYWLKASEETTHLTVGDKYETESFELHQGANLISYCCANDIPLDEIDLDCIEGIIGEGIAASWIGEITVGSLTNLSTGKGYWVKTAEECSLEFECTEYEQQLARVDESENIQDYAQSTQQAFYFIEDIENIEVGDMVSAYCNDTKVGSREWIGAYTDIPAMGNDSSDLTKDYCTSSSTPAFRVEKANGETYALTGDIPLWESNGLHMLSTLQEAIILPESYSLAAAYPNPFNPTTTINFAIPSDAQVSIAVYNLQGREIVSLANGTYEAGFHEVIWNAESHSSGVYFISMIADEFISTQKLMLVK